MRCFLVSHTHWDREWYRTFQAFRARLVDTIDRVLDLIAEDAGFHFLLDGQTVVIEDYLEIRPQRRGELEHACRTGRIAIGPWYVQPDSLLPSGEAHIRNLLHGRRVGSGFGPVSTVAYCPDSFGHPAQFPQLFRGFGLEPFIYWRGNGDEIDTLPAEYLWQAPDGSTVLTHHLSEGYFAASGLPQDAGAAARWLAELGATLHQRTRNDCVLFMNGIDHARPEAHTKSVAEALAQATGWSVRRGLLDDFAQELSREAPRFQGELVGGRVANLLPGVWSARMPLKLRNRRVESQLKAWAEPWCALGTLLGVPDERPALRMAWSALLQNQAHDSICGCSQDLVHEQMRARYDAAEELAAETATRVLERLAGLGADRRTPREQEIDLAVFNPSPHSRTDIVRFALEPDAWFEFGGDTARTMALHPWLHATLSTAGFTVDGIPARLVRDDSTCRVRLLPEVPPLSVEFVAANVPAFGWRRFRLAPGPEHAEVEDGEPVIANEQLSVRAAPDGTLTVRIGHATYSGLGGLEDIGDRGDTYDFDPVRGDTVALTEVTVRRHRHPSGIERLTVRRVLAVPAALDPDRTRRGTDLARVVVDMEARIAPGGERVDLRVRVENGARDHRLRLLFPTGRPADVCHAATTFDVARRPTAPRQDSTWIHPAPATFPHQGFVSANGLTVAAPGLPEAEVTAGGVIAITLVRAVGWLARIDLHTRPQPAGPALPVPGAQCIETIEASLALFADLDVRALRDAEIGLRAVAAGMTPLLEPGRSLLAVDPADVIVTALKPAEAGAGVVLRILNPTDTVHEARVHTTLPLSCAVPVRLDETPCGAPLALNDGAFAIVVPPHALRSVLLG